MVIKITDISPFGDGYNLVTANFTTKTFTAKTEVSEYKFLTKHGIIWNYYPEANEVPFNLWDKLESEYRSYNLRKLIKEVDK